MHSCPFVVSLPERPQQNSPHDSDCPTARLRYAAAHGMDFLLTWNCRHILNAVIQRRLAGVCLAMGLTLPVLCTPSELMANYLQS